jgi:hypothetical protein
MIYIMVNEKINEIRNQPVKQYRYDGRAFMYLIDVPEDTFILEDDVIIAVNKAFSTDCTVNKRNREMVNARKLFYFFCKDVLNYDVSLQSLANNFKNDHSTVLHHVRDIKNSLDVSDRIVIGKIQQVCDILGLDFKVKKKEEKINMKMLVG